MVNLKDAARDGLVSVTLISAFLIALLFLDLAPAAEGPIMIITMPLSGKTAMEVVALAGGAILSQGRWPWIAVGVSSDPDFSEKLEEAGAVLLLSPLTNACLKNPDPALQGL